MPDLSLAQVIAIVLVGSGGGYFTIRRIVDELKSRWRINVSPVQVRRAIANPPKGVRFESRLERGRLRVSASGYLPQPPEPEPPPQEPGYEKRLL